MKASLPPGARSIFFGSGNGITGNGRSDSAHGLEGKLILQNVLFSVIGSSVAIQTTEMVLEFCAIRFGGESGSRSKSAYVENRGGLSVMVIESMSVRLRVMAEMGSCSLETVPSMGIGNISRTIPWILSCWIARIVASEGKSRMALMLVF